MAGIAWVDGRLLPPEEAAISPLDRGFLYGEGLFETIRAYGGKAFRLQQHLDRLSAGADGIGFTPPDRATLGEAVQEALAASELREASVRLTVTPGPAGSSPTLVVLVRPLSLPPSEHYSSGCQAVSVPAAQVRETPLRRTKALSYLDKVLAQREAARRGAHEAILVDPDGCVVEGAMRNVFAVVGDALITPPLSRGFLRGITRAAVLEIAAAEGIAHAERDLPLVELRAADECFLTSSLAEILPVTSVDGSRMARGAPGPITQDMMTAYRSLVARENA